MQESYEENLYIPIKTVLIKYKCKVYKIVSL